MPKALKFNNEYVNRFMKFREGAFAKPGSYFGHYTKLSDLAAKEKAEGIWQSINGLNLEQKYPSDQRERAHLILRKGADHMVEYY